MFAVDSRIALASLIILMTTIFKVVKTEMPVFDNQIEGTPEIECLHDSIRFKVDTMKRPPAQIYVKGNMDHEECVFHNAKNATIPLNKCNMRRKRDIQPTAGVGYTFTVVVQLHPAFVTKVDRAYNVHCFYMEQNQHHTLQMEVSEMTTQSIEGKAKLPECVYTIHKDSPNGPIVKFAVVGQALYHVWDCPSTVYKMMLHSCYADNGAGTKYQVVDDKGCAIEDYLMPQINYNNELTRGVVATSAFGFADKTSMMFACEIQLCFKEDVDCANIMPPKCGTSAFPNPEENKIIGNDLETDQLIASSSSSTSTTTSTSTVSQATSKHPKSLDTMPADFPRPNVLPFDEIEGSGEDKAEIISTTTTSTTTAPIKILEKSSARTQRHSGPKPRSLVNLDVQSPEFTVVEDYLEPTLDTASSKPLFAEPESNKGGIFKDRVCVPSTGFYGGIILILIFCAVILVLLINSRKSLVHKFNY